MNLKELIFGSSKKEELPKEESKLEESKRISVKIVKQEEEMLGKSIGAKNLKGRTALHKAAKNNNHKFVKYLLETGIEVNEVDDNKMSALHLAATAENNEALIEMMKWPKVNLNLQNKLGETPLHEAVRKDKLHNVKELLKKCKTDLQTFKVTGSSSISVNTGQSSALHYAFYYVSSPEIVKELINIDKKLVNQQNQNNETPLHSALFSTKIDRFSKNDFAELFSLANLSLKTSNQKTYLHAAANNKHLPTDLFASLFKLFCVPKNEFEVSIPLLNEVDDDSKTALFYLIINKKSQEALLLLEHKANPNLWKGKSPLHFAIENNMTEVVIKLLECGADPNVEDKNGKSPLMYAAEIGNVEIINALKKYNADFIKKADLLVKKALLNNNSDALIKLIEYGASPKVHVFPAQKNQAFLDSSMSMISNDGEDKTFVLEQGDTPLHYAIRTQNSKLAKMCLQKISSLNNEANNKGETPAHLAIKFFSSEMANLLYSDGAPLQFSVPYPGKNSFFDSNVRQNTLFMTAASRGFENDEHLLNFFKNPNFKLTEKQLKLKDKFLQKFESQHVKPVVKQQFLSDVKFEYELDLNSDQDTDEKTKLSVVQL